MPRILIALIQALFLTSSIIMMNGAMAVVRADTPLNSSNWLGTDGAHYWHIKESGTYYLDIEQDIFCTTHNVAIFIQASDVILDGKGKTITGSGPPSVPSESGPDVYGVRANAGVSTSGIQVKNLNVEKKYYGVIFEAVSDGAIENVNASGNHTGIYLWDADNNTISGNTASDNLHVGIVLDADNCVNSNNTFSNNIASSNVQFGILLWLECPNTTLTGNVTNNNGNTAIALTSGCDYSTLTGNRAEGNPNGIHVKSSNNEISSNSLNSNTNVGLWLDSSNNNNITNNVITYNQNAGIWLTSSTNNSVISNTVTNNRFWGIFLGENCNGQTIYDNYFSNLGNAGFSGSNNANTWNISKTAGVNIVGGPFFGGNFWAKPDGTGFSQTTPDSNQDGFCDSPYSLSSGNVDQLPLHTSAQVTRLWPVTGAHCGVTSTLWAEVTNMDIAALPSNAKVWFWVDGPNWSGSHWVGSAFVSGLSPGSTKWYSFNWPIPSDAAAGTYTYKAQVWSDSTAISNLSSGETFTVSCSQSGSLISGLGFYPTNGGWIEAFASDYSNANWFQVNWGAYNSANGESRVATGDIDGDGKDEIVIGLGPVSGNSSIPGGWFEVLDDDYSHLAWGRVAWSAYNSANGETWPACGDVDGDGKEEIIIGLGAYPANGGWFEIFDYDAGSVTHKAWKQVNWPSYNSQNGETRPATGDIDNDGKDEIVVGLGNGGLGWIEIFDDASSGYSHLKWRQVQWSDYNTQNGETWPACGDVDGDGKEEIIIGLGAYPANGGWFEIFDYDAGSVIHKAWKQVNWPSYNSQNGETRPACGDMDGDGVDEIVIGLGDKGGGWMEVVDDASAGYAHRDWVQVHWSNYNIANGGTWPAVKK